MKLHAKPKIYFFYVLGDQPFENFAEARRRLRPCHHHPPASFFWIPRRTCSVCGAAGTAGTVTSESFHPGVVGTTILAIY